jgi:hypothetical protein
MNILKSISKLFNFIAFSLKQEFVYKALISTGIKGIVASLVTLILSFLIAITPYESQKFALQYQIQKAASLNITPYDELTEKQAIEVMEQQPELDLKVAEYLQSNKQTQALISIVMKIFAFGFILSLLLMIFGLCAWNADMRERYKAVSKAKIRKLTTKYQS